MKENILDGNIRRSKLSKGLIYYIEANNKNRMP